MIKKVLISVVLIFMTSSFVAAGYDDWTALGNNQRHISIAVDGPNVVETANIEWIADESPQGYSLFQFESATGAILYNGKVYAVAKYLEPNEFAWNGYDQTGSQLIAYNANSGQKLWNTVIDPAIWDSWSTPTVDVKNNTILIATGNVTADGWYTLPGTIYAIDALSGSIIWSNQLDTAVLNASVCVADGLEHGRAFITDYDGFGTGGKLYCINLDPNTAQNPYNPGQIIWSDVLGATIGNTPAYKDGVVYVSSNGDANEANNGYGAVYAYEAAANTAVRKWIATDPNFFGFTSGVTITKAGYLYAACYNWDGGENNSALCKIDCNDGEIIWITQTERTSTMPVVVGNKIYISGGFNDYNSVPKVSAFQDLGDSVIKLWETPPDMVVGGWTNQLVYADGKLYVGAIPLTGNYFGSYEELYILNAELTPEDEGFIIAHHTDTLCGNNPVVVHDSLYTIGAYGLVKFHQPALLADIDDDKVVNYYDLFTLTDEWLYDCPIGVQRADFNLNGRIDFSDFALLANKWHGEIN
ncbi:MAG: PQQ-binding-like beta-propeller repeat protein [Phycisphaerae bacterium]|nr:PQQ-binding-like beta-propeller repeat protein [Phycisphaerae bacterium]